MYRVTVPRGIVRQNPKANISSEWEQCRDLRKSNPEGVVRSKEDTNLQLFTTWESERRRASTWVSMA